MAELLSAKRPREDETQQLLVQEQEETKRHKSFNHILSLLDEEEEEPNQDLSSLITSLQEELSSDPISETVPSSEPTQTQENSLPSVASADVSSSSSSSYEDEEDKERVIRHLLEASDDELGIPQSDDFIVKGFVEDDDEYRFGFGGDSGSPYDVGLWEFEDETANYYTLLQSELFM